VSGEDCGAAAGADVAEVAALPGEAIGPQLAGRDADYIIGRLTAYKANETVGAQSALMWGQAAMLSDDDMQQLAEYITTF